MKRFAFSALILALALTLAACGGEPAADQTSSPPPGGALPGDASMAGDGVMATLSPEQQAEMEAFLALLEQPADVQGVITKVVGNEITLSLIEPVDAGIRTFRAGPSDRQDGTPPEGGWPEGERPEGDGQFFFGVPGEEGGDGETRAFTMTTDENGNFVMPTDESGNPVMPEGAGEMIQRGQGGGAFSMTEREIEVTYTGEETSITIPAALTIQSGMRSIQASALAKNQVLSLWYGENGEIANAMVVGSAKQD